MNKKNTITLIHFFAYITILFIPFLTRGYDSIFFKYFTLIYIQWMLLGGCLVKGDTKNKGEPCDFVRALYILGVFKDKRYIPWLSYLSNNIAAPTYIYCGLNLSYGFYSFIFPFIYFFELQIVLRFLWKRCIM